MELEFSRETFEKFSDIKFREDVSGGSRVFPWGVGGGREKDTKKLVVPFSKFANAPQNQISRCNDKQEPESGGVTNFRNVLYW